MRKHFQGGYQTDQNGLRADADLGSTRQPIVIVVALSFRHEAAAGQASANEHERSVQRDRIRDIWPEKALHLARAHDIVGHGLDVEDDVLVAVAIELETQAHSGTQLRTVSPRHYG